MTRAGVGKGEGDEVLPMEKLTGVDLLSGPVKDFTATNIRGLMKLNTKQRPISDFLKKGRNPLSLSLCMLFRVFIWLLSVNFGLILTKWICF